MLNTTYREGVDPEPPEPERVRVHPMQAAFASGAKVLNSPSPTPQKNQGPKFIDMFFEFGGRARPRPGSQPQQQAQPAVKSQPIQTPQVTKAPTRISPERARKIAKYRAKESKISLRERKHNIRLLEAENTLKRLIQVSVQPTR